MSDVNVESVADAIYDKMSELVGADHKGSCIKQVLMPWIQSQEDKIHEIEQQVSDLIKALESEKANHAVSSKWVDQLEKKADELDDQLSDQQAKNTKWISVDEKRPKERIVVECGTSSDRFYGFHFDACWHDFNTGDVISVTHWRHKYFDQPIPSIENKR